MEYLTDEEVINKLWEGETEIVILNYIDFAKYLADRISRSCITHERSDIQGTALLALVEGVSILRGHPNPRAFLREKIHGAVINLVRRNLTISKPDYAQRLEGWQYLEDVSDDEDENLSIPQKLWHYDTGEEEKQLQSSFLLSALEKKIIKMRIDGDTIEEIAVKCQMSFSTVQRIIHGMRTRVEGILDGRY